MASFTNNPHKNYYDTIDAVEASTGHGAAMKQVRRSDVPRGTRSHSLVGSRGTSTFIRTPETEAIAQRRANEARGRAKQNWTLAKGAVYGASAMKKAGEKREKGRAQAGWSNPLGMVRESMGGPRAVSPRSEKARKVASTAAANKRSAHPGATERRRREEQDGRTASRSGRRRAQNNMRQKHSLQDDIRALSSQLRATSGYYFGTLRDQYYQKMIEKATSVLGDGASDNAIQTLATQYYDQQYHPGRNQGSRSSSSSGSRSSSTSSRPSHGGPAPLSITQEMLDRSDHPNWFLCPITMELMTDPVILSSGQTYERSAITAHLRRNNKDPVTNFKLKNKNLTPNMALRHSITAHLARLSSGSGSGSGSGSSMGTQTTPRVQGRSTNGSSSTRTSKKRQSSRHAKAAESRRKSQNNKGKKNGGRRKTKRRRSFRRKRTRRKRTRRKKKKSRKTKKR